MATLKDGTALYEVERRVRYAERPGFRITKLQIGRTQEIPSRSHTQTQDTFYPSVLLSTPSGTEV
jgi:hypothetical protein